MTGLKGGGDLYMRTISRAELKIFKSWNNFLTFKLFSIKFYWEIDVQVNSENFVKLVKRASDPCYAISLNLLRSVLFFDQIFRPNDHDLKIFRQMLLNVCRGQGRNQKKISGGTAILPSACWFSGVILSRTCLIFEAILSSACWILEAFYLVLINVFT